VLEPIISPLAHFIGRNGIVLERWIGKNGGEVV
jgi:hypothetical protein